MGVYWPSLTPQSNQAKPYTGRDVLNAAAKCRSTHSCHSQSVASRGGQPHAFCHWDACHARVLNQRLSWWSRSTSGVQFQILLPYLPVFLSNSLVFPPLSPSPTTSLTSLNLLCWYQLALLESLLTTPSCLLRFRLYPASLAGRLAAFHDHENDDSDEDDKMDPPKESGEPIDSQGHVLRDLNITFIVITTIIMILQLYICG